MDIKRLREAVIPRNQMAGKVDGYAIFMTVALLVLSILAIMYGIAVLQDYNFELTEKIRNSKGILVSVGAITFLSVGVGVTFIISYIVIFVGKYRKLPSDKK